MIVETVGYLYIPGQRIWLELRKYTDCFHDLQMEKEMKVVRKKYNQAGHLSLKCQISPQEINNNLKIMSLS